ncbi:unnamed protein product, partial [Mesorhabditis spiculigera]
MFIPDEHDVAVIVRAYNVLWCLGALLFCIAIFLLNGHPLASRNYKIVQINLMCACQFTDTVTTICKVVFLAPKLAIRLLQITVSTLECLLLAQVGVISMFYIFFSFIYAGFAKVRLTQRRELEIRNRNAANFLPFGILLLLLYVTVGGWHLYFCGYVITDPVEICKLEPLLCNQPQLFLVSFPPYAVIITIVLVVLIASGFFGYMWALHTSMKAASSIVVSTKTRHMMEVFEHVFHFQMVSFGVLMILPHAVNLMMIIGIGHNDGRRLTIDILPSLYCNKPLNYCADLPEKLEEVAPPVSSKLRN